MRNLTATICLTIAVLFGSPGVSWSADFQKGLTAVQSGDFATALQEFKPLAKQGDARAQYNLGLMYRKGQGVPQDDKAAVKWYRLAAEQGDASAQNTLGLMYAYGQGVPENAKTAMKWYTLAAKQGYVDTLYNLGVMYANGFGVRKDYIRAHMWWSIAASSGYKDAVKYRDIIAKQLTPYQLEKAQNLAGLQKGLIAVQSGNFATALQEFQRPAERGNAKAQHNLGLMYRKGQGVSQDDRTAVKWCRLAAEQGLADAQFNLGTIYSKGQGVPQDDKTAVKWWRLAAEQGLAHAQTSLGGMYAAGEGVIRDNFYAHMWGNIAASNGNEDGSKLRDVVENAMTSADISTARKLARECVRKNYKGC